MALLPQVFNPNAQGQQRMRDITPVPNGKYIGSIKKSDKNPVKDDTTQQFFHWDFQIEILAVVDTPGTPPTEHPTFIGKMLFTMLNLANASQQAMDIAHSELASMCDACNIAQGIQDTTVLHGIPMLLTVKYVPEQKTATAAYAAKNKITKYEPYVGAGAVAPNPAIANVQSVAPVLVSPPTPVVPVENQPTPVVEPTPVVLPTPILPTAAPVPTAPIPPTTPQPAPIPAQPEVAPTPVPTTETGEAKTPPWGNAVKQ